MSVAERVAFERAEDLGKSCGYSVRFESVLPRPHASVLFCTVGMETTQQLSGEAVVTWLGGGSDLAVRPCRSECFWCFRGSSAEAGSRNQRHQSRHRRRDPRERHQREFVCSLIH